MITGVSVDLKEMDETDIEQVRQWRNSREVSAHMLSQQIISQEQQVKWFETVRNNATQCYFVIMAKNGNKLGVVNFSKIEHVTGTAEPGLYIGEASERNSLYGMEAYYLLLKYGFEELNLQKVYGTALVSNPTAMKMNKSFGYAVDEIVKDGIMVDGVPGDLVKLHLLRKDFYASPMVKFFQRSQHK
ncbi:UDP-4-amino-4,6-dideoxy-N-acetyl-beta-L-altrosamine N-acetyltransferase [Sediminibacterium sp.]|uniref:UDP-4-amino-4, 6-dideoxy-N-acetyl-beta-L-altrosamine N-acetyltransferase n=1 Tax=Sediminibacterium sp. TaxID=1917865 RepID=UPI0025CBEB84|nr:UDP-4-amino-4,6-dideoxy-N-acetyl-beta-L-altrosamine N-acetyltransferase [Sediminibacterium sp.]MBW0177662.1 UDP-4-amino-4,6-dideoxy-N-acetyl-beta-L-altrosamine N-acetyltransferase [Sediminibacterium sp.]